jgi:hypothetical protein
MKNDERYQFQKSKIETRLKEICEEANQLLRSHHYIQNPFEYELEEDSFQNFSLNFNIKSTKNLIYIDNHGNFYKIPLQNNFLNTNTLCFEEKIQFLKRINSEFFELEKECQNLIPHFYPITNWAEIEFAVITLNSLQNGVHTRIRNPIFYNKESGRLDKDLNRTKLNTKILGIELCELTSLFMGDKEYGFFDEFRTLMENLESIFEYKVFSIDFEVNILVDNKKFNY